MDDDFVTVATSEFAPQAESIRLLLSQEGIDSFIADANLVNTNWFLGPAVGYIKVQVLRSRSEAALAVLKQHPLATGTPAVESENAPGKCLACGSPMAEDDEVCPKCGWSFEGEDEPADAEEEV